MTREEYIAEVLTRPRDFMYWGDLESPPWGWSGIGHHRDSDILGESNWETISSDLLERFPESFVIERSNHWAVGWCEQLRVNTEDLKAVDAILEWKEALYDYPVADEEDYSQREWEARREAWKDYLAGDIIKLLEDESPEMFTEEGDFVFGEVQWDQDFWDQVEYDAGGHYFIGGAENYIKDTLKERLAQWQHDEEFGRENIPLPF